jgi:hypothetical protein
MTNQLEATPGMGIIDSEIPQQTAEVGSAAAEIATYLHEPTIAIKADPLEWWSVNRHRFPRLSAAARKYLSAPPTSVESERTFSISGEVADERRSRLLPDNFESLVFLKCNMPRLNFTY